MKRTRDQMEKSLNEEELYRIGPKDALKILVAEGLEKEHTHKFIKDFITYLIHEKPFKIVKSWLTCLTLGSSMNSCSWLSKKESSVCGYVFKRGDFAYICEKCQVDDSCLVCKKCFDNSDHAKLKGHKPSIIRISSGGGCCDCGDPEAWSPEGFCKTHRGYSEDDDPTKDIPETTKSLISIVHHALQSILTSVLYSEEGLEFYFGKEDIDQENIIDKCSVVVHHNKEQFEQLMKTFQKVIHGLSERASGFYALRIDKIGRMPVYLGDKASCEKVRTDLKLPNKIEIIERDIKYISDKRVHETLDWLVSIMSEHDGIRNMIGKQLLKPSYDGKSIVKKLICIYDSLPNDTQKILHQFLFELLKDREFKFEFAVAFTEEFSGLVEYINRNIVPMTYSVLLFSVQLFTLPNITPLLVQNHKLFEVVLDTLKKIVFASKQQNKFKFSVFRDESFLYYGIMDLEYLFSIESITNWLFSSDGYLQFESWIEFFTFHQNALLNKRIATGDHADEGDNWLIAMDLLLHYKQHWSSMLNGLRNCVARGSKINGVEISRVVVDTLKKKLINVLSDPTSYLSEKKTITNSFGNYQVFKFDVSSQPVSFYIPSQRLFSTVVTLILRTNPSGDHEVNIPNLLHMENADKTKEFASSLIELPLRLFVLHYQVKLGMWKRNGDRVNIQSSEYNKCMRDLMFEPDLMLLQIAYVLLNDSNHFITTLIDRFDIDTYLHLKKMTASEDEDRRLVGMVEGLLYTVVFMLNARKNIGISTEDEQIKHELIQFLWLGKKTHSEIETVVGDETIKGENFEEILSTIAQFQPPTGFQSGGYVLKQSCKSLYTPLYPYYSLTERETANEIYCEYQTKLAKSDGKTLSDMNHIKIPTPPKIMPAFKSLLDLYGSRLLHKIIFTVLYYSNSSSESKLNVYSSPALVEMSLYLIQLSLIETSIIDDDFFSINKNFDSSDDTSTILTLLMKLLSVASYERNHSAVRWVLNELSSRNDTFKNIIQSNTTKNETTMTADQEKEQKRLKALEVKRRLMEKMSNKASKFVSKLSTENEKQPTVTTTEDDEDNKEVTSTSVECIICHEEHKDCFGHPWGHIGFIQYTNLDKIPENVNKRDYEIYDEDYYAPIFKSCGHNMHYECYDKHIKALLKKHFDHEYFEGHHLDIASGEFFCPLCKTVSNILVTSLPHTNDNKELCVSSMEEFINQCPIQPGEIDKDDPVMNSKVTKESLSTMTTFFELLNAKNSGSTTPKSEITTSSECLQKSISMLEISSRRNSQQDINYYGADFSKTITDINKNTLRSFIRATTSNLMFKNANIKLDYNAFHDMVTGKISNKNVALFEDTFLVMIKSIFNSMYTMGTRCDSLPALRKLFTYTLSSMLVVQAIQSVINLEIHTEYLVVPEARVDDISAEIKESMSKFTKFYQLIVSELEIKASNTWNEVQKYECSVSMMLPFLRRCSLLSSILFDTAKPQTHSAMDAFEEYHNLVSQLNLDSSSLSQFFDLDRNSINKKLIHSFIHQAKECIKLLIAESKEGEEEKEDGDDDDEELTQDMIWEQRTPLLSQAIPFTLIPLPEMYSDVLEKFVINSTVQAKEPALCLICGTVVPIDTSMSQILGPCAQHTASCSSGNGIFLVLNKTRLLAISNGIYYGLVTH
eukprot:TRINITY_DN2540_c0_g1_i3.p1 TRINITY_DN2540_c0_g1~~TRINITY_DN2540_c0_g1_i3.p1  ORF type:complete len:1644 (+),score=354.57 TRINITY_DN2540_c0_g1_i3:84-5015(+)